MRFRATAFAALAACSLIASPVSAGDVPDASAAMAAEERLDHISIVSMGSGTPVVLIPGLSTPRDVWSGLAPQLAGEHQVLLVQVNGFGGDDPGGNLEAGILDAIVDELSGYIAAKNLAPVRMIGHSMGGSVTLKFARAHPELIERAMIVDSLPFFAVLMDPSATVEAVRPTAEMMRNTVASRYGQTVDPAVVEADVKSLALKPESIVRMKEWAGAADPRVTAQALYDNLTTDLRPALAAIATPTTIVVPWNDQAFGEERTLTFYKTQYATLPAATFVGIGDAGHFVMLDQPRRFADEVRSFLR